MLQQTLNDAVLGLLASAPVGYLVLWVASAAVSIALIVLLRTRWGQSRPLQKCAVLSLLVHVLLAWAAMTVRIVSGDGDGNGEGTGPAIRVHVVEDAAEGPMVAAEGDESPVLAEAPPLLEPPKEPEPPPETVTSQDSDAEEAAADPPTEEVAADTQPATTIDAPPVEESVLAAEAAVVEEVKPASDEIAAIEKESAVEATSVAARLPTAPRATSPYSLRTASDRLGLVEQQGGSGRTESAVGDALGWLASVQSRDGRWDADEHGSGQEQMVLNQNRGGAGRGADTGVTALALLAFLGAGHSHLHGDYRDTVQAGIDFLIRSQAADGSLFGESTLYAQMYCHSMATFALAEAQAMTGDRRLESAVRKAINFSIAAQNPTTGGWRYRPGDTGDTSQLGWQMMALCSARRGGIEVPDSTWMRVERFLSTVRRGSHGGLASYRPDSPASTSMTAEALYCRLLLLEPLGGALDDQAAKEATANLLESLPTTERVNLYYWYYATLALHHRFAKNGEAAEAWSTWNEAMSDALVATQMRSGANSGSWDTGTIWGGYGGRVYTTAMAAMCLEVYYRYAPVETAIVDAGGDHSAPKREPWTATRGEMREAQR